jgi:hypothetical protein
VVLELQYEDFMTTKKQPVALNRISRGLYARVRKLHEETKSGTKNPEEAARLRRAFGEIRADIRRIKELNYSRPQALAALALSIDGAKARDMLEKMSSVELRGALSHLIERANAGDKEALTFCGAAVGVIAKMPAEQRPTTITKLARMVNLPDYDVAAVEIHEANFFLEVADRMLPRLEVGQLPTSQDLMAIGQMRRELDGGGGWRDIATLAEANVQLRLNPDPDKENDNAPPDSDQPDTPDNTDGQDRSGQTDPPDADAPAVGEADKSGANQSRSEGAEGEQV